MWRQCTKECKISNKALLTLASVKIFGAALAWHVLGKFLTVPAHLEKKQRIKFDENVDKEKDQSRTNLSRYRAAQM